MSTRESPAVDPSPRPRRSDTDPQSAAKEDEEQFEPEESSVELPPPADPGEPPILAAPEGRKARKAAAAAAAAAPPAASPAPAPAAVFDAEERGPEETAALPRPVIFDDQIEQAASAAPPPVEVRKVRRVLRRIDTWSLLRFSLMLYLCGLVVFMTATMGMWVVAEASGAIPHIENFITQLFALKHFTFNPFQLLAAAGALGLIGVFVATFVTVLTGVLFNLISDVVGGVELTVLEEEPLEVVG